MILNFAFFYFTSRKLCNCQSHVITRFYFLALLISVNYKLLRCMLRGLYVLYPKICPRILPPEIAASGISWLFKLVQESDKRTFLISQTKIRVSLIFQGSGFLTQLALGFWLILAQFWSGERYLAFNQELRVLWVYSQKG